jgi:hypothetical protein
MALNTQIFQQLRKQAIRKKRCKIQQQYKENATRLYSGRKPKEDLEQSGQSHYNSQFNLNKQAYAQYENALQTEQSDAPCNFIKLYHLYLMKIALIKRISREKTNTTSRYHSSIMKMTYHIKKKKTRRKFQISPLDGAQYANVPSTQTINKSEERNKMIKI